MSTSIGPSLLSGSRSNHIPGTWRYRNIFTPENGACRPFDRKISTSAIAANTTATRRRSFTAKPGAANASAGKPNRSGPQIELSIVDEYGKYSGNDHPQCPSRLATFGRLRRTCVQDHPRTLVCACTTYPVPWLFSANPYGSNHHRFIKIAQGVAWTK